MSWVALKWLAPSRRAWWRDLSILHHHVAAIVLHEAVRSEMAIGSPTAVTSLDDLIACTGANRFAISRALNELADLRFIRFEIRRGRGAQVAIAVCDPDAGNTSGAQFPAHINAQLPADDSSIESGSSVTEPPSSAQFPAHIPAQFPDGDQDLARSLRSDQISDLRSDLRSSTSEDLTSKEGSAGVRKNDPLPDPPGGEEISEPGSRKRKVTPRGIDASKIPDRAFAAADYLRTRIMGEQANTWVSRQPWNPETKTGARLKWANEFRLCHEQDKHAWEEIARTVAWLFAQPLGGPRYVVQSPESLREKWDKIQAVRANTAVPRRSGIPDNREPPAFKSWAEGWDK